MNAGVLLRELWQSWRASLRRPGFVLLAGLTLALGVGFATPLLAVVLALRAPLPLPQSDRVVAVELLFNGFGGAVNRSEYKLLSDFHDVYQSVGVSAFPQQVNVSAGQVPQLASLRRVDRQYLFALQPRLLFGRYFSLGEDRPGGARAVIVSHRYWLSRLAGRRDVIGAPACAGPASCCSPGWHWLWGWRCVRRCWTCFFSSRRARHSSRYRNRIALP